MVFRTYSKDFVGYVIAMPTSYCFSVYWLKLVGTNLLPPCWDIVSLVGGAADKSKGAGLTVPRAVEHGATRSPSLWLLDPTVQEYAATSSRFPR